MNDRFNFSIGDVFFCPKTKTKYTVLEVDKADYFPYLCDYESYTGEVGSKRLSFELLLEMKEISRFLNPHFTFIDFRYCEQKKYCVLAETRASFDLNNPVLKMRAFDGDFVKPVKYSIDEAIAFLMKADGYSLETNLSIFYKEFEQLKNACENITQTYYKVASTTTGSNIMNYEKMNIVIHNQKLMAKLRKELANVILGL